MDLVLKKPERDALAKLLLFATKPARMAEMGFEFGGPEYKAALKVHDAIRKVGAFDPDCDDWGGK